MFALTDFLYIYFVLCTDFLSKLCAEKYIGNILINLTLNFRFAMYAMRSAPCVRFHACCVYATWACSDIGARFELNSMCQSQYKQNAKQYPSDTNENNSEPTTK